MSRSKVLAVLLLAGLISVLIPLSIVLAQGGGGVTVGDSDETEFSNKLSDKAAIELHGLPALAPNEAYEGWLVSQDGSRVQSAGILTPDADGNVSQSYMLMNDGAPTGENLLGAFNKFIISIEPVPDSDPAPSANKPYTHSIPAGAFAHVGHLAFSWQGNPAYGAGNFHEGMPKGISVGLREQTSVALVHAGLSFESSTLADVKTHACHTVNIIEGSGGDNYDGSCGDPGDGFGVVSYAVDAAKHAGFSASAASDDSVIVSNGQRVIDASGKASAWASQARDESLAAIATDDLTAAKIHMSNAIDRLDSSMTQSAEAYAASQDMGTFTVDFAADIKPPKTGDSNVPGLGLLSLLLGAFLLVGGSFVYRHSKATT